MNSDAELQLLKQIHMNFRECESLIMRGHEGGHLPTNDIDPQVECIFINSVLVKMINSITQKRKYD